VFGKVIRPLVRQPMNRSSIAGRDSGIFLPKSPPSCRSTGGSHGGGLKLTTELHPLPRVTNSAPAISSALSLLCIWRLVIILFMGL